jgi:peptidoglycan/xylan/chitin deacetylase (PgdA/CDA1 family)
MDFYDKSRVARKLTLGIGVAAAGAAAFAYAVRSPRSRVFGPSVWHGPRDRRAIALTFDDGPSESTPGILDLLDRYRAPATFFQCGLNVRRLPEIARAVRAGGHEIGNHSYTHLLLAMRSPGMIEEEFARTQQIIARTTGFSPVLLRAPFGVRWFGFRQAQQRLGLLGAMWTVIGYDWSLPSGFIVDRVKAGIANGAIICLHDGRQLRARPDISPTLEAVRVLVPLILERGYKLETVSQLLCPTNSSSASAT